MNEWIPVIEKVQKAIVRIVVVNKDGDILSEGTGTIINSNGRVLTAWHVVESYSVKDDVIYVFTSKGRYFYYPITSKYSINFPSKQLEKLNIDYDIAFLDPIQQFFMSDFLMPQISDITINMGSDLLLCGYSEETPNIIDIESLATEIFNANNNLRLKKEMKIVEGSMKPPTYKAGILSHTVHFYSENPTFHFQYIHVDNAAHGGMSGGPIIDSKGQFVAIITQRTTVHFNIKDEDRIVHIDVPSGSTIGMTLNLISLILYKGSAII